MIIAMIVFSSIMVLLGAFNNFLSFKVGSMSECLFLVPNVNIVLLRYF